MGELKVLQGNGEPRMDSCDAFVEVEPYRAAYERKRRAHQHVGWVLVGMATLNLAVVLAWYVHWLPVPGWITQYGGCVVAAIATAHLYMGRQRRKAHDRMMEVHTACFERVLRSLNRKDWPVRKIKLEDK